jgi:hypothetical protein
MSVLWQVFEEGLRRNGRIVADGVTLPDVKHYGQSQVHGVGDAVDGCKTLLRQPGGLVGMMGKECGSSDMACPPRPVLDDKHPCKLGEVSDRSDVPESLRGGHQVERQTYWPYCCMCHVYGQPCLQTQLSLVSILPLKSPQ